MEMHEIISRAWTDEAFKQKLLAEPKKTMEAELGVTLPEEIEIFIHEQTPTQLHLILPMKPDTGESA
ncbi:MAG TPA: NHLP leader peptide family RiPP precursor [Anaerolineae bacterium]|nr:NHLP leader peptide family RiPP precursor [Anaerolineae bacterium]